ncbi:hypothetical protein GCM10023329_43280 [Streptomyces sanyensis]|uniref:Transposase n=1 Tax=Streptomyces sanyensis TaxID=568869 RepID=A0ABP9AYQ2_9ACTN
MVMRIPWGWGKGDVRQGLRAADRSGSRGRGLWAVRWIAAMALIRRDGPEATEP